MQEYKRLKPFAKGLFTGLIREEKMQKMIADANELDKFYSTDLTLEGKKADIDGRTYTWVVADCGVHAKLTRTSSTHCRKCAQQKHLDDFSKAGQKVIGRLSIKHYLVELPCGHLKESQPLGYKHVDYCAECKKEAALSRFPIGSATLWFQDKGQNMMVALPCGHTALRKTHGEGSVYCKECNSTEKQAVLDSVSATENPDGTFKLSCGHDTGHVNWKGLGKYKCKTCLMTDIANSGIKFGLTPTYNYSTDLKAHEFVLQCGHRQYVRASSIDKVPVCKVCGKGHYHKPSDMYLIACNTGDGLFLKFGVANDTSARIREFTAGKNIPTFLISSVGFKSKFDAIKVEKALHKKYKESALDRNFVRKHLVCGFTECYPSEMMDTLLGEFRELTKIYAYSNRYQVVTEYKNAE